MAKNKSGGSVGGFVFNFFNVGFTVVMFLLPTAGLVYWYVYIRDPRGGVAKEPNVIVQEVPRQTERSRPVPEKTALPQQPASSGFFNAPAGATVAPETTQRSITPAPARPLREEHALRRWQDPSGKFSIEARFYSVIGDKVKIVTSDDKQIEVEIAKLCDEDKEYIRDIFREKGIQPRF